MARSRKPKTDNVSKEDKVTHEREPYIFNKKEKQKNAEKKVEPVVIVPNTIQFFTKHHSLINYKSLDPSIKIDSEHIKFFLNTIKNKKNELEFESTYCIEIISEENDNVVFKNINNIKKMD